MRKLVLLLMLVVFLSGCVGQELTKGNGVVIQSFVFDVKEIEPDIPVTLGLHVKNFGAKQATEIFAELQGPPEWTIEIKGKADTLPARQSINSLRPPDPERGITEGEEDYVEWIMKAPKKETKITHPFQAVVYYKYITESESLLRIVTKDYYREKGERGGLVTSKTSSGPLNVIISLPSSITSGDSPVDIPVQIEIQNVGGGRAYKHEKDFKYPKENTKDVVEITSTNLKCDEREVKIIDGVGRVSCKFTSDVKINNFQDFPINIRIDYRYYTTALTSITVSPFEIKDKSKFKNDVITIHNPPEYPYMATSELRSGETGKIEFWVKNNGDKTVDKVEINFFDPDITIKSSTLRCEGVSPIGTKCIFEKLKPLEQRKVEFRFPASDNQLPISFYVNYSYSTSRIFAVPLIDDSILKEPPVEYYQSERPFSPVLVTFETTDWREVTKGRQTTKEYFGRKGLSTELKIKFSYLGTGANTGDVSKDFTLPKGSVKLKLIGPKVIAITECGDFEKKNDVLVSTREIKPMSSKEKENTLTCPFIADFDESWKIVNAEVSFDYTYQFIRHQTIVIKKV